MNVMNHVAILTAGIGLLLGATAPADATIGHFYSSNAVDKCQAFTPGVSNTIRNRVIGAQNIGTASIAVACVFEMEQLYGQGSVTIDTVTIRFNNGDAAQTSVSCTLLPGSDGTYGTAVNQTAVIAAGANGSVSFSGPFTGLFGIGVNCTLPPNVTINSTVFRYQNAEV